MRALNLQLDEQSYMQRFAKVRGFNYNTMEIAYFVTAEPLDMAHKKHKYFGGTNRVNHLGPIACPPFTAEHHHMIQWKDKKDVFSMACKAACKVGGAGPEGSEATVRKPETWEPFSYHSYLSQVWAELIHSHSVEGVVDFTTGPGYVAEACLMEGIPYVGFTQTAQHEAAVRRYLFRRVWELTGKVGHRFFEPELHTLLQEPEKAMAKDPENSNPKKNPAEKDDPKVGGSAPSGGSGGASSSGGSAPSKGAKRKQGAATAGTGGGLGSDILAAIAAMGSEPKQEPKPGNKKVKIEAGVAHQEPEDSASDAEA